MCFQLRRLFCCYRKNKNSNLIPLLNNKIIYDALYSKNYNILSSIDISNVYNYIYNYSSIEDIVELDFNEEFLINYYNTMNKKHYSYQNLEYLNEIIKRLITIYIFINSNIDNCIKLLYNKKYLFDIQLWTSLILDPKYNNDNMVINTTIILVKYNIIQIHLPIKYYNINFSLFDLIILGKMEIINEMVIYKSFFNDKIIFNFINKLNNPKIKHNKLLYTLEIISQKKTIDKKYIIMIESLLFN